ncbi:germ cell-less protein-like 2 [Nephila pilipes]|uniref:Germ cell-less protein-like 2 n=1 Tax=Nephila pilipes TaxID=299642 RepID=A0A8X6P4P2_NEPPI|nr:germ cell-less protein-like 2 [Nephila pilipes]
MGNTVAHSFLRSGLPLKRKAHTLDHELQESEDEDYISTPKRRKVMSTTKYVYKTLFEEGQGSDVKIAALNRTWNLHKLYLSQSPYFNSMFNGLWIETSQREINIGIEDENITTEALHKVFGSLYQDEIQIMPLEAVSILASATLLQLDDLIQQSIEVMKESINIDTVLLYHEAAELYGLVDIKNDTLDWLYKNMDSISKSSLHLQQISCDLMTELISSHKLVVVQTEYTLYALLRSWVFLKENCIYRNADSFSDAADLYFKNNKSSIPFLSTIVGTPYVNAFRALRLQHLVVHHVDMEHIEADYIIPIEWFMPIFKMQWYRMLRVDQGADKGPKQVSEEDFNRDCLRCGRVLQADIQHSWRWTGFNFGFDIVITYKNGCFKLRRFQTSETESPGFQTNAQIIALRAKKRHLMYRICVYSLDKNGKTVAKGETDIKTVTLNENEQITVLSYPSALPFPLIMSANFLLTTPLRSIDESMPSVRGTSEHYA